VIGQALARDYQSWKPRLMPRVLESFARLALASISCSSKAPAARRKSICARATSPIWVRARRGRAGLACWRHRPGRGDRQLVGCQAVIEPSDAALIKGFIVNKFRGDPSLFEDGMAFVARRTGWRALGLYPFRRRREASGRNAFGLRGQNASGRGRQDRRAAIAQHRQFRRSRSVEANPASR